MTDRLQGRCDCGAVRYHLTSPPMFVNCCHCLDCQRQTGSAFVINAIIEADRVVVEGAEPVPTMMKTDSGRPHEIYRCPTCHVGLWSIYGGRKQFRFVRVGTLEDPRALAPDAHIFTRSKQPWVDLGDAPQFEIYYDMQTQWSRESLARRDAAMAG